MNDIQWGECKVKLGDVVTWDENPRYTTDKELQIIRDSFTKLNQFQPLVIGPNNELYDGHQRVRALLPVLGEDYEVTAYRSSRALDDDERRLLALYSRQIGRWNWDILKAWDLDLLSLAGMDVDFGGVLQDDAELAADVLGGGDNAEPESEDKYMSFAQIPIYEPSGKNWSAGDLAGVERYNELIREINQFSSVCDDAEIIEFLMMAATRFIEFNYSRIADFYANASPELKDIMERLALVIIDYNKAIENGFVASISAFAEAMPDFNTEIF